MGEEEGKAEEWKVETEEERQEGKWEERDREEREPCPGCEGHPGGRQSCRIYPS